MDYKKTGAFVWSWVLDQNAMFLASDGARNLIGYCDNDLIGSCALDLQGGQGNNKDLLFQLVEKSGGLHRGRKSVVFQKGGKSIYLDFIAAGVYSKTTGALLGFPAGGGISTTYKNWC